MIPDASFPEDVVSHLLRRYGQARVILEYGSGGSTLLASRIPDKFVMSVESDPDWALRMQWEIDTAALPSPAVVYPVDIGPTGAWGRPRDPDAWTRFHRYPLAIWDEPFFRPPDVILIDGRFRAACFATALMRITRPVIVLFDDYTVRPQYHQVERFAEPVQIIDRMAEFHLTPQSFPKEAATAVVSAFFQASFTCEPAPKLGALGGPEA